MAKQRNYKQELKEAIARRDFLLKDMGERKTFTSQFILNVAKELGIAEKNISLLTTLVEMQRLQVEVQNLKSKLWKRI